MASDLRAFVRYARGLRGFLREPLTWEECRREVVDAVATREQAFLRILDRGVFERPGSPYGALLRHAGVERGDVASLVSENGLEGALEQLRGAGVYVSLDEFRGRRAIERAGLHLETRPEDFDNPLIDPSFVSRTGGSRGGGRRVLLDFDHRRKSAVYQRLVLETFSLMDRPSAVWRAAPPGQAGIGGVVSAAKAGKPVERWFSHNRLTPARGTTKDFVFTAYTIVAGRRNRLPWPEHVPVNRADRVARWLADKRREGTPALISTTSSSGVRACLAAEELGLDVSGTFFRLGGEPLTRAKADTIERSGGRAVSNYSMSELGRVGIACATPTALDDLHLTTDQLAVIQHDRTVGGTTVGALLYTTLLPSAPKLMLNVESDDYGTLERRECGCLLGELGLTTHVHGVRSYEKLTSEGMTFVGSDLFALLDDVLPRRFGGRPTDYQLVEEEIDAVPSVSIVIDPAVGDVDEAAVVEAVVQALREGPGYKRMMADVWRDGGTLRVVRREPYTTGAGKIQPLHIRSD